MLFDAGCLHFRRPDHISPFAPFVDPGFLAFGSIQGPIIFPGQLLFELAGLSGTNALGYFNSAGTFTQFYDGSGTAGSQFGVTLGADTYTLGFRGATIFSSIQANNYDGQHHILGQHVVRNGTVNLGGRSFNVQAGDYVLYMEDLYGAFPVVDQDFNDQVVLLRASNPFVPPQPPPPPGEVPEPGTVLLLGSGVLGFVSKRKRRKAV